MHYAQFSKLHWCQSELAAFCSGPLRRKGKADLRKASPASSDIIEDIVKELAKAAPGGYISLCLLRSTTFQRHHPGKEEPFLILTLSCFLSKGIARETVPKEVLWKLNSRTLPLSGKRAKAMQATATPGKGCFLAIRCHQPEPACACRFLPWYPLLHLMAAAKPM